MARGLAIIVALCSVLGVHGCSSTQTMGLHNAQTRTTTCLRLRGGGARRRSTSGSLRVLKPVTTSLVTLGRNPATEAELLRAAFIFSYALSRILAASGENVVSLVALTNGVVYFAWQVALSSKKRNLLHWMRSHFLLNYDFKSRRTRALSMVLSEFSHADKTHLAANMGTLWAFGPYAVSVLGTRGFARLYSGGALASAASSCLWPTIAPKVGVLEARSGTCLGASGALSAVVMFVCLHNSKSVVAIPSPSWLQLLHQPTTEIKLPLGVAGLMWLCMDLWGLFRLKVFFNSNDFGAPKIAYSAHVGGALFGALFYAFSGVAQLKKIFSRALAIPRWILGGRQKKKGTATPPYRLLALLLLLAYWKWPLAFHNPLYYISEL